MAVTIHQGDALSVLRGMESESVQACISSPPYFGLRAYGTEPQIWGGDPEHAHEWEAHERRLNNRHAIAVREGLDGKSGVGNYANPSDWNIRSEFCQCGAWRGELGQEPTPDDFVASLVAVYREVRRVLRKDGIAVCNLGDSYSGSGKGTSSKNGLTKQHSAIGSLIGRTPTLDGIPAKNLLMMPFRVALALQADGWIIRSVMPWLKRNPMPESAQDRPTSSVEYLFLLSKSPKYFWDPDAIRMAHARLWDANNGGTMANIDHVAAEHGRVHQGQNHRGAYPLPNPAGRSFRNSDPFFATWQGLMLDEGGDPLALVVNPSALKEAHFASFPTGLVIPFVKAGTSERGCCAVCGAPWVRVVERGENPYPGSSHDHTADLVGTGAQRHSNGTPAGTVMSKRWLERQSPLTTGWRPSCAHEDDPVAQTVLDPFSGSGTTLLVADRLGRSAIGIDLNPKYCELARTRIDSDAPMLSEPVAVEVAEAQLSLLEAIG